MSKFGSIMVYVETLNGKPIPYANEYFLSSAIREILSNTPFFYEDDIHGDNEWTRYTISRIFPLDNDKKFDQEGIHAEDYSFIFRSLDEDIGRVLKGSLGINPLFELDESKGKVKKINKLDEPNWEGTVKFTSRSPVLLRTPSDFDIDEDYLEPSNCDFEEALADHILNTYTQYTGESVGKEIDIQIDEYDKNLVRVTSKDDIKAPAYSVEGKIDAPSEVLEVIYHGGMGSLTGMGLGCWDVVE